MGRYLGSWKINDTLTWTVNTHTASTGAATDADAVPSYRVYEDETGTAILTGNMAKLDDANTTGFYSEQITLSAANGLEKGKSYNIYVSATVDSVVGTDSFGFQIEAEVDANAVSNIGANVITATSIASNAIAAAKIASGAITSAKFASGAITATAIAADAIGASELAADAVTEIQSGLATAAALATVDGNVDSILADTNELQGDWANGGRLDLLIDAVKAKTDSLTFTVAGTVNANITYVNEVEVTGDGSEGTEWGPA